MVLLSNATDRLEEDLERLGVLHEVDEVYNSSRLGLAKPDPRIFAAVTATKGWRHMSAPSWTTRSSTCAPQHRGACSPTATRTETGLSRFLARLQ